MPSQRRLLARTPRQLRLVFTCQLRTVQLHATLARLCFMGIVCMHLAPRPSLFCSCTCLRPWQACGSQHTTYVRTVSFAAARHAQRCWHTMPCTNLFHSGPGHGPKPVLCLLLPQAPKDEKKTDKKAKRKAGDDKAEDKGADNSEKAAPAEGKDKAAAEPKAEPGGCRVVFQELFSFKRLSTMLFLSHAAAGAHACMACASGRVMGVQPCSRAMAALCAHFACSNLSKHHTAFLTTDVKC